MSSFLFLSSFFASRAQLEGSARVAVTIPDHVLPSIDVHDARHERDAIEMVCYLYGSRPEFDPTCCHSARSQREVWEIELRGAVR